MLGEGKKKKKKKKRKKLTGWKRARAVVVVSDLVHSEVCVKFRFQTQSV
jgi:hypothetical protein